MKTKHTTAIVGGSGQTVEIPPGLRVTPITKGYFTEPTFFLDEFPKALFPSGSIIHHDATHYGVRLTMKQVRPETPLEKAAWREYRATGRAFRFLDRVTVNG